MRRSEEDYLKAYEDFQRAKESFRRVLDEWSIGETRMHLESSGKLQKSFKVLEAQGLSAAAKAVDATAKNIPQPPKKQTLVRTKQNSSVNYVDWATAGTGGSRS